MYYNGKIMFLKKEKVSVVIPLYNEEKNIEPLYRKIKDALTDLIQKYEIIFVDDGSYDKTFKILKKIHNADSVIKVIRLSRNFGQAQAILAGSQIAGGDIIVTMDGDLENDPRDIPKLLQKMDEGFSFVSGWRWERRSSLIRRLSSFVANWLMWKRTGIRLHDYGCALCVTKRDIINRLKDYGKDARFIKPLLVSLTDSVSEVRVRHHPRERGASKYNLFKIMKAGLDFMINFSTKPEKTNKPFYVIEEIIGK